MEKCNLCEVNVLIRADKLVRYDFTFEIIHEGETIEGRCSRLFNAINFNELIGFNDFLMYGKEVNESVNSIIDEFLSNDNSLDIYNLIKEDVKLINLKDIHYSFFRGKESLILSGKINDFMTTYLLSKDIYGSSDININLSELCNDKYRYIFKILNIEKKFKEETLSKSNNKLYFITRKEISDFFKSFEEIWNE